MTDKILEQILLELQAIKAALNARPLSAPAQAKTYAANATQSASGEAVIPQPSEIIQNAGAVLIHFGKNQGRPLGELTPRSLEWYAAEKPAKTDSSGKPYPPRPADVELTNAARTLWHQQKGTLAGAPQPPTTDAAQVAPVPTGADSEIPF